MDDHKIIDLPEDVFQEAPHHPVPCELNSKPGT
jgi:hypothetical protein